MPMPREHFFTLTPRQAAGRIGIDVDAWGVDLLSLSAHKVYGPKGIGVLFARSGVPVEPIVTGGGQEKGLRPGTVPAPLACGIRRGMLGGFGTMGGRRKPDLATCGTPQVWYSECLSERPVLPVTWSDAFRAASVWASRESAPMKSSIWFRTASQFPRVPLARQERPSRRGCFSP